MKVRNRSLQCLVDTGSVSSVISSTLVSRLGLDIQTTKHQSPLLTANGQRLDVLGEVDIIFHLKGLKIPHTFTVVKGLRPNLILGSDFLRDNYVSVNYRDNTVQFYDDMIIIPLQGLTTANICATLRETTCIPRFSEAIIPLKIPVTFRGNEIILEPLQGISDVIAVAGSISDVQNNIALIKVLNYKPHSVILKKGFKMASVIYPASVAAISEFKIPEEDSNPIEVVSSDTLEQFAMDYKLDLNPELSKDDRHTLLNTLYEYKDCLARTYKDLKIHKGYKLDIDLKDPTSRSYTRQYRLSKQDAEEADKQILELRDMGVLTENTDCTFNSPCFLVTKKSGDKRLVVDLRKVNQLIKPRIVMLPKIDEILAEITALKGVYFSKADLYRGYYQLLVGRNSHVTGFTSPKTGLSYRWVSLPMGLASSPAGFIQALYNVFKDKNKFYWLFLFVDDLLLVSKTISEHVEHLKTLCQTLRANNLVLNATKTCVAYTEVRFFRVHNKPGGY